jgi:hypothetical protein
MRVRFNVAGSCALVLLVTGCSPSTTPTDAAPAADVGDAAMDAPPPTDTPTADAPTADASPPDASATDAPATDAPPSGLAHRYGYTLTFPPRQWDLSNGAGRELTMPPASATRVHVSPGGTRVAISGPLQVVMYGADSVARTGEASGVAIGWRSEDELVVYRQAPGGNSLVVVGPTGADVRMLYQIRGGLNAVAGGLSPDRAQLVVSYQNTSTGRWDLAVLDVGMPTPTPRVIALPTTVMDLPTPTQAPLWLAGGQFAWTATGGFYIGFCNADGTAFRAIRLMESSSLHFVPWAGPAQVLQTIGTTTGGRLVNRYVVIDGVTGTTMDEPGLATLNMGATPADTVEAPQLSEDRGSLIYTRANRVFVANANGTGSRAVLPATMARGIFWSSRPAAGVP